jgi:hypothetical protein
MILFTVLLASAGVVLGGEPTAKAEKTEKPLSNTRSASCLITITSDPAILALSANTLSVLARSSGVAGIAAREVLGNANYEELVERLDLTADPFRPEAGDGTFAAGLQIVLKPETKPAAEEFLRLLIVNLKGALEQAAEENCKRLQENLHRAAMVQVDSNRELRQTRDRIGELQKKVGRSDVSRDGMFREVERLEKEKQSLEMERAGREARREALEKAVAETSEKARVQIASDTTAAELEKLVALLEGQVKAMKEIRDKGRASEQDLTDLQIRLAEAKGRLAARDEAVLQAAGGDLLAKLNAELTMLSIDAAECDARLKAIEEQLVKAKDPERFKVANEFTDLKEEEAQLSDRARFARRLFDEQQSRLINLRPVTVTVLGGIKPGKGKEEVSQ